MKVLNKAKIICSDDKNYSLSMNILTFYAKRKKIKQKGVKIRNSNENVFEKKKIWAKGNFCFIKNQKIQ